MKEVGRPGSAEIVPPKSRWTSSAESLAAWALPSALTRMTEDLPLAQNEAFKERMHPRHIAPLIVYLASDLAKDVTKKIFFVGGGQISEMRMVRTQGASKKEGVWTPDEIAAQIGTILG